MKTKKINFQDIKTRDELLTRVPEVEDGYIRVLSVGNKMGYVSGFLSETPDAIHTIKVVVRYTPTYGKREVTRYV